MSSPSESSSAPPRRVHLLSNGHYTVMLNQDGGGYTHWKDLAVTRWREDSVSDPWGTFLLLRDEDRGEVWSATGPSRRLGCRRRRVSTTAWPFSRANAGMLSSRLEIAVDADERFELRRLQLSNHGT